MNTSIGILLSSSLLLSCGTAAVEKAVAPAPMSVAGTWQLISGTLIAQGDTSTTDYTKDISFIKIINDTHFAFLQHDLTKGRDSAVYVSGGGAYTLTDSLYTEHLEYCSAREWEGHDFSFTMSLKGDTLIQRGIEVVESEGVNRENIETYIRLKK